MRPAFLCALAPLTRYARRSRATRPVLTNPAPGPGFYTALHGPTRLNRSFRLLRFEQRHDHELERHRRQFDEGLALAHREHFRQIESRHRQDVELVVLLRFVERVTGDAVLVIED